MRIAIVGAGISGLTAAYALSKTTSHEVTVFEGANRVGGHTYTVDVDADPKAGRLAVDMGFIVFNEKNYPNFSRLLKDLGVESQPSEMSFSVRSERSGVEYRATSLNTVFAQRKNLFSKTFLRMIGEVVRFKRQSLELLAETNGSGPSLREYVDASGYSSRFWEEFLMPMGSAIWSATPATLAEIPASFLVRFFAHHGFLNANGGLPWRTVRGGSARYLERLVLPFEDSIRLGTPVKGVRRLRDGVRIATNEGAFHFDHVILAVHSDQALAMLQDPSQAEIDVLGAIPYQRNETVLHTDKSLLPKNRRARASWNYLVPRSSHAKPLVTYDSNRLQQLSTHESLCVTLNQTERIQSSRIIESKQFHHPVFTGSSLRAHARLAEISGPNRTSYCGAYWGYGFHEDGVTSGLKAVEPFGASL